MCPRGIDPRPDETKKMFRKKGAVDEGRTATIL